MDITETKRPRIYLPGLNGLRAIAAITVVMHHVTGGLSRYKIIPPKLLSTVFENAASGYSAVVIFFVISGFLITYLLLLENRETGSINIKKFYLRRILRIWPLYFLYLFITIIIAVLMHYTYAHSFFWYYFIFAGNVALSLGSPYALITHYWSLAAEEQFYLFWPVFNKRYNHRLAPVLIILITLFALIGMLQSAGVVNNLWLNIIITFRFMLMGCFGAWCFFTNKKFIRVCFNRFVQLVVIIVLLLIITSLLNFGYLQYDIVAIAGLVLIIALASSKSYFLHFENKVFNYLGKVSYGIYVIHPFVIWLFSTKILKNTNIPKEYLLWIVYFSCISVTIGLAGISYHFFERPFLKIKKRFTVVQSAGTPGGI